MRGVCQSTLNATTGLVNPILRSNQGMTLMRSPSSTIQALLQAAVFAFHTTVSLREKDSLALSPPTRNDSPFSTALVPVSGGAKGNTGFNVNGSPLGPKKQNLFLGKFLRATHLGAGILHTHSVPRRLRRLIHLWVRLLSVLLASARCTQKFAFLIFQRQDRRAKNREDYKRLALSRMARRFHSTGTL